MHNNDNNTHAVNWNKLDISDDADKSMKVSSGGLIIMMRIEDNEDYLVASVSL